MMKSIVIIPLSVLVCLFVELLKQHECYSPLMLMVGDGCCGEIKGSLHLLVCHIFDVIIRANL